MRNDVSRDDPCAIDLPSIMSALDGDMDLVRELARLFLAEYPILLEGLRAAVARRDATEIRNAAHALKGSVSNFRANEASDAALALELAGRSEDLTDLEGKLARLDAALVRVHAELEKLIET